MKQALSNTLRMTAAASTLGFLAISQNALASGFSVPEISTAGLSTANAMVANPDETGAFAYNPAAMGFHDTTSASLGAVFIGPRFDVTTASGNHDSQGASWITAPLFNAAIKVNDKWRAGLTVNAPFGLETRWDYGTFPALSQSGTLPPPLPPLSVPTGSHPTTSKLEIIDFAPTLAYRASEHLSLGAGLDLYWAKSAALDSNLATMGGNGAGLGFNLSALYSQGALSLGIAFRSAATAEVSGSFLPQNATLERVYTFTGGAAGLPPPQPGNVDVNLPWRLQLGARYEINAELAVEFDWTRIGWSQFDTLKVKGVNTGLISEDTNKWHDANAYRFGATYQVRPETQLRFGYSYDERAQDDAHFSARVPDTNRQLFSIGVAQSIANGYSVELGYMYVLGEDRKYRSTTPWTGGEVNGTSAIDGDYGTTAHLIGLELTKTF